VRRTGGLPRNDEIQRRTEEASVVWVELVQELREQWREVLLCLAECDVATSRETVLTRTRDVAFGVPMVRPIHGVPDKQNHDDRDRHTEHDKKEGGHLGRIIIDALAPRNI